MNRKHEPRLSRRLMIGGALAVALGQAGAGQRAGAEPATPAAEPAATPGATPVSGFPRVVRHALGETTLPVRPHRIAASNDLDALDNILALGLKPVYFAASGGYGIGLSPWAAAAGAGDIPNDPAPGYATPDPERFVAAHPDLIVATWLKADLYEVFAKIAPTMVLRDDPATPWQDIQRIAGEAMGEDALAAAAIAETETVIAEQRVRLAPYTNLTIAVAYNYFGNLVVNGKTEPMGRLLTELGMTVLSPPTGRFGDLHTISAEQIGMLHDADLILSPDFGANNIAEQAALPVFRELPAVANGHWVTAPTPETQALFIDSALSTRWATPRLVDAVIAAAEGKGTRPGS